MKKLIRNGTVVDGTGRAPFPADVLLIDDRVAAVGKIEPPEDAEIFDASGMIVTPALIDIHRHADAKPLLGSRMETELRQGIATIACGVCGFSLAPRFGAYAGAKRGYDAPILGAYPDGFRYDFPGYLNALEAAKPAVNMAAFIGMGAVRIGVNGMSDAPLTKTQTDAARGMIEEALDAGAAGVSAGIMYLPEFYTTRDEYRAMLAPLKGRGKPFAVHMRGEGNSMVKSVDEVLSVTEEADCPLHISHFKSCGRDNWGREIFRAIERIEAARRAGRDVTADFYPYTGGSTSLTTMLPPAFVAGDMDAALERLGTPEGADAFRASCAVLYPDWDNYAVLLGWDRILISGVVLKENEKYLGMDVVSAARKYGFADAEALAAHLMHSEHGATAIINLSMSQSDVDAVAALDWTNVISDSIYADTNTPHPRMYGAFPRFIRRYALDEKIMSVEKAVRKAAALPAKRIGLRDRGVLTEGAYADVLVFDPDTFGDTATYETPVSYARGVKLLTVNGVTRVTDDAVCGEAGGSCLRRTGAAES